jgi:hypothetical protein
MHSTRGSERRKEEVEKWNYWKGERRRLDWSEG